MAEPIRVAIVDDHPVVRQGLKSFLQTQENVVVVAEAGDGDEAQRVVQEFAPDVVLMDLVMPRVDGIAAIRRIRDLSPSTKVIVLTSFADDDKVFAAVRAGAAGYLLKDVDHAALVEAIRTVHSGGALLHPTVAGKLMQEIAGGRRSQPSPDDLTERETQVLRLVARGMANKAIALELGIAEKTARTHVSNILQKLHVADRTQAALYAVRERLVDLE